MLAQPVSRMTALLRRMTLGHGCCDVRGRRRGMRIVMLRRTERGGHDYGGRSQGCSRHPPRNEIPPRHVRSLLRGPNTRELLVLDNVRLHLQVIEQVEVGIKIMIFF